MLLLLVLPVSAATPVANFSGTPVTGTLPLTVSFNDGSSNLPTGWAWFFGDETYTQPWTLVNASSGWLERDYFSAVVMPDGSIVLMGGYATAAPTSSVDNVNDTWRSTDNGATWVLMNASSGWTARSDHTSVALPDGSIVLMGGQDDGSVESGRRNDTWRSTDNGATWTQMTANAEWTRRYLHTSVAMPDGSIVLMGGSDVTGFKNDTWRSTDNGATWVLMNANAEWQARTTHSSIAMPDGSIILSGGWTGSLKNDVWRSTDNGAIWTQMNASAGWSARSECSSVPMPDGSIVLLGGYSTDRTNDVWRSADNGAFWTQVNASAGWSARNGHRSVAIPDGSIILMGGHDSSDYKNDTWRFQPVGSSLQNPSHTYTATRTWNVSLQVYNNDGYDSTIKTGYISVTDPAAPIAGFSGTPTSGSSPLSVSFTDSSTNTPTGWAWFFGDEDYSGAWTLQTAAAGWSARRFHSSVVLPDGKIILTGGDDGGTLLTDVWMSADNGATWTRMTADWLAPAREYHSSVALSDGSFVVMGGQDTMGLALNDVLRSTNNGATWSVMADPASWPARYDHSSVAMPDGSIVLMGGDDGFWFNDVWRSVDKGATWTQMTAAAGWTGRQGHTSVALPDGSIVMMGGRGGSYLNDVWRSTDNGATWTQMTAAAGWSARADHTSVVLADGSILLMGGHGDTLQRDIWRSTDKGATWTQVNAAADWSWIYGHTAVAMPDGSVVLMGGDDGALRTDVWHLQPAGSSLKNPSHTYNVAGSYQVSLQAYNNDGYNNTIKSGYITVTAPTSPVADFSGTPTTGTGPLAVSFTDSSTNTPTGWAWFFGDEDYSGAWTQQTAAAGWSQREGHAAVVMPDGTIVLTGGIWGGGFSNETWKSADKGASWTLVNASSGWCPRQWHTTVALPDGSIILMGGEDEIGRRNDVWRSVDSGATWSRVNANAAWSERECHSTVALSDGTIVLTGGYDGIVFTDDVWRSADKGATWTLASAAPGWAARHNHATVVMPDNTIILMGGEDTAPAYRNDVWKSTNAGSTWIQVTAGAAWSARGRSGAVVLPDASIVLMGGEDSIDRRCDIWRSIDYGATWTQANANADWSARQGLRAAAMPDGSIVLMGGYDGGLTNDVWRLQPAGSLLQNPSHTFTTAGSHNVSLQAYNNGGYDSIQKAGYITVTSAVTLVPVASFTATPTTGTLQLAVTFTDTSTNFPDAWNWSFGDGTFSTLHNPAHTYTTAGTYTVALNATNAAGSNTSTRTGYIIVTNPPAPVTDNVLSGGSDSDSGGGASSPAAEPEPEPEPEQQPEPGQQQEQQNQQLAPFEEEENPSPEELAPVEGLEDVSVVDNYPIGYTGLDYNSQGDNVLSIDREAAEQAGAIVTVYFDRITSYQHSSPGVLITFWGDQFDVHNGLITGNVTRAEFITDPLIVNVSGGTVAGRIQAALTSINQEFEMENEITGIIPPETVVSYNTILSQDNLSVAGVAYLMKFRRGSLTTTGAANVTLTVPPSWVTRHGGRDAVRIARTGDTGGRTELLATTYVGTDDAGNMVFSGDSPNGTSIFGLITSQATAAEKKAHPNVTYIPGSKPAMATNIGMIAWIATLVGENPVLLVILLITVCAIVYLGWWRRRL